MNEILAKERGWQHHGRTMAGDNWFKRMPLGGELNVIVSVDDGSWHLSISHRMHADHKPVPGRYPTYEEIKEARYLFCPDELTMAMLFPPTAQFVNLHDTTFHLWQVPGDE